jgi:hypothetical protein
MRQIIDVLVGRELYRVSEGKVKQAVDNGAGYRECEPRELVEQVKRGRRLDMDNLIVYENYEVVAQIQDRKVLLPYRGNVAFIDCLIRYYNQVGYVSYFEELLREHLYKA